MKIHKLNCVMAVFIVLLLNFNVDVVAMNIEQLQQQHSNIVIQTAQRRVASLARANGISVATKEINRIISDSSKTFSEEKRKELLQIVDKTVTELSAQFKRTITTEKDISTGVTNLLTKLCKEVAIPYMQIFLEKLPIIMQEICVFLDHPSESKGSEDTGIAFLFRRAVEFQEQPATLEPIARTLIPIITVGIVENSNNIFTWNHEPLYNADPDTVFIKLTAHKKEIHLAATYKGRGEYSAVYYKKADNLQLAQKLARQYKIHLMPKQGAEERVFIELAKLIKADPELQSSIYEFKIKTKPYEDLKKGCIPKIVIYVTQGKEAAQYVLDKLYAHFKDYEGYGGYQPRYNCRVTNFLYFAQGDGDYKSSFPLLFEEGKDKPSYTGKIYFRSDFTSEGANEGYHLTLPPPSGS